ncbi:hypothetical protein BST36_30630, partial [Mycolicibacterium moriokaense]
AGYAGAATENIDHEQRHQGDPQSERGPAGREIGQQRGSVGAVLGSLTAGLGLSAPFAIYGVALLIAAAVVFFSLRGSDGPLS